MTSEDVPDAPNEWRAQSTVIHTALIRCRLPSSAVAGRRVGDNAKPGVVMARVVRDATNARIAH
jgi:hypothetical protein